MPKILKLIKDISNKLNEQTDHNAWYFVEAISKKRKLEILTDKNFEFNDQQKDLLDSWIKEYTIEHKPIQYIIGSVLFLDLNIFVEPPTLIPRPETEDWCNNLINTLSLLDKKKIKILDIGTGTGCIGISLAKKFPQAQVWAIDISDNALQLAKQNIIHNKVNNVTLIKSDLFENLTNLKFDLIVSNPPYIDQKLYNHLDPSVRNWEDVRALISEDKGLYLIKEIIAKSPKFLNINDEFRKKNIPQLVIEIDCSQGQAVEQYLKENNYINIKTDKDIHKKDRVVSAGR